ncbi:hypothetical protein LTR53_009430 [Teratosphaeriaceae sp. CCFEE 6253]|nr:hypothetical protein LTR53_009430 [Teratosphaeriaceae sp. CCFEE 6253]
MPLTECSVNTQHDLAHNKRHSIQSDLAYTRVKDENSPSQRTAGVKATPPLSKRLLAPTKASAAKAATPPSRAVRVTTPRSNTNSRLPRRATPSTASRPSDDPAPGLDQATLKTTRALDQTGLHDQSSSPLNVRDRASDAQYASSQSLTRITQATEKPLPPRPIASLVSCLSPTKDSRTLVDAREMPLKHSVDGSLRDWAAISPAPAKKFTLEHSSPTESEAAADHPYPPDRWLSNDSSPLMNKSLSTPIPDDETTYSAYAASERSSSSNFISADDGVVNGSACTKSDLHGKEPIEVARHLFREANDAGQDQMSVCSTRHPPRGASLRSQHSPALVTTSPLVEACPLPGFTEVTQRTPTPIADSRPHSPSPASFSRPRPNSLSHGRSLPSQTGTPAHTAKVPRAQKTASRIPIPDTKKATLVDVKVRTSASTLKSDHAPSFGSRRLDAPDALKILDHGIKRRQMIQTKWNDTERSTATPDSCSTQTYGHNDFSHIDRSDSSTPEDNFGKGCLGEEATATSAFHLGLAELPDKSLENHTSRCHHNAAVRLFDDAVAALALSTTPPSQVSSALEATPTHTALSDTQIDVTDVAPLKFTHFRNRSDFADLNKRLSSLHTAHADHTASRIGDRAPAPESTKYSLLELLNEYTSDDYNDGQEPLDPETRKHVTRTLSVLEGKGRPARTDVDNETLLRLFGHLKRGLERQPENVSLIDNAAAAEKYLEHISSSQGRNDLGSTSGNSRSFQACAQIEQQRSDEVSAQLPPIETVASKWSESTGSVHALSPILTEVSPTQRTSARKGTQLEGPPQRLPPGPPYSIGYPYRIVSKASRLIGPSESGTATPPEPSRRLSSPTLGKRKPGSVRAARETLHHIRGGFTRTTASAESKKSSKMPTPNTKPLELPGSGQRGRTASAQKLGSTDRSPVTKKPLRARSKSRYVLDKINGMFTAKHGKRGSAAPPVPAIAELDATPGRSAKTTTVECTFVQPMRGPQGAKMPTMALEHLAMRSDSRDEAVASVDSPVDSVMNGDGGQPLHNWAATLISKAARERDPSRKERLVAFAKVLNDSMISAREAQISAETAQHAARSAQMSYEMTQQSVAMLQRLAASLTTRSARRSISNA